MNGGYLMVSKADTNLYTKLNNALTVGKPILWYEDANTCYYIDTITKSGTDIVLTKGGKTITIESDGDITESGDIQVHLYEYNIVENDYGFKLLLPFKLDKIVDKLYTNQDLTDDEKEEFTKLYNYFGKGIDIYYSGYSVDTANDLQKYNIVTNDILMTFTCYYVEYSSGNDNNITAVFTVSNGKVTAINSIDDNFKITLVKQIF